ncbi:VCBS repeat-containing protein [Blastopirellula marina]|uniref:VCBS repeat-containing protein n=1 Tax=Blastopirellula marina TaxID=124 RepID=A0A2S8G8U2_9BACT|nr:hypothetical protein C5Y98_04665 [Blastopirellula marina]PTL45757.1 VCBS repeat-containing protein [Blastopirellula marina]
MRCWLPVGSLFAVLIASFAHAGDGWKVHKIADDLLDHQRLVARDLNRDGLLDVATIATDPNQSGTIQVYLHPGKAVAKSLWRAGPVGNIAAPSDLVIADLDGDGKPDLVTSHQNATEPLMLHRWSPGKRNDPRSLQWTSETLVRDQKELAGARLAVGRIDTLRGEELICAGVGVQASIGWLQRKGNTADFFYVEGFHPIAQVESTTSILARDLNHDGLTDLVFLHQGLVSPGIHWLTNPGPENATRPEAWLHTMIGSESDSITSLAIGDIGQDKLPDVAATTKSGFVRLYVQHRHHAPGWKVSVIPPAYNAKEGTCVAIADLSGNGRSDVIHGALHRDGEATLVCYRQQLLGDNPIWIVDPIAVLPQGTFETVMPYDMDHDGDLDLLMLQRVDGVGKIVWYENPS